MSSNGPISFSASEFALADDASHHEALTPSIAGSAPMTQKDEELIEAAKNIGRRNAIVFTSLTPEDQRALQDLQHANQQKRKFFSK